jgi:Polyketide cyclase / dehydrase and lipid transport
MGCFEIRATVNCPVATVFSVYTDTDAWRRCTVVTDVQWVMGKPWDEGSRMRVRSGGVVPTSSDQVVLHFEPNRRVAYMSHFFGITLETRLTFRAISDHATEIHMRGEFVGAASRTFGFALGPAIERGTLAFVEALNRECERLAPAEAQGDLPATNQAEEGSEDTKA